MSPNNKKQLFVTRKGCSSPLFSIGLLYGLIDQLDIPTVVEDSIKRYFSNQNLVTEKRPDCILVKTDKQEVFMWGWVEVIEYSLSYEEAMQLMRIKNK